MRRCLMLGLRGNMISLLDFGGYGWMDGYHWDGMRGRYIGKKATGKA